MNTHLCAHRARRVGPRGTTFALLFAASLSAAAGGAYYSADPAQIQSYQGIRFVTGGFGIEERDRLTRLAAEQPFNLKLEFATAAGHYLGGAKVRVEDANGRTRLETVADGPWLLASLEPGTYTVHVTAFDHDLKRSAEVPASGVTQVVFSVPTEAADPTYPG